MSAITNKFIKSSVIEEGKVEQVPLLVKVLSAYLAPL